MTNKNIVGVLSLFFWLGLFFGCFLVVVILVVVVVFCFFALFWVLGGGVSLWFLYHLKKKNLSFLPMINKNIRMFLVVYVWVFCVCVCVCVILFVVFVGFLFVSCFKRLK